MHLFGHNRDHDYYFELLFAEEWNANQLLDVLLHTMAMSGLFHVRTELHDLLVIPFLAHHPKQTNCYFLAMAPLAILQPRRIVKWMYLRCHSGIVRLATCAASTNKKRSRELPCLVICTSRRFSPL